MRRSEFRRATGWLLPLLLLLWAALPAAGQVLHRDGPAGNGGDGDYAYVQFGDPPLALYSGTRPGAGKKLDLKSAAARQYGNRLQAQHDNYIKWLAKHAPQVQVVADYTVTFNGVGLKLNGATLDQVKSGPGAVAAGLSGRYGKAMNVSTALIHAGPLWAALGGRETAGAGVLVGIVDSGIDQDHVFFDPAGYSLPPGWDAPLGDSRYTTHKVVVARVFHQNPWLDARAVDSHGTHVAGTVAGRAGTAGASAADLGGVAPGAWLGNYNVFPGNVANAFSLFIAKAVEQAVTDGMDVLNLSLGGRAHQGRDLLDMAVDGAANAGVVVAIAAGNSGPGLYTVGSPGTAGHVITAAATTNAHQFVLYLESPALPAPVPATTGTGAGEPRASFSGDYVPWTDLGAADDLACEPLAGADSLPLAGKVALIRRGVCFFSDKINHAAAAGAGAVIIYNRADATELITMSTDGVTIPAVMISHGDGLALKAYAGARTVAVQAPALEEPVAADSLADFSSWGPTPNYTLKPDVAAPGVNVYSSVPGNWWAAFSGTSMATPHVAGASAALLAYSRMQGLDWGPAAVKAALMGTADPLGDQDVLKYGAGRINLDRARQPAALASPPSLSFGLVRPVGNHTYRLDLALHNPTGSEQTYSLANQGSGGLAFSPATVTVAAGATATVAVTVDDRGAHVPGQWAYPEYRRGVVTVSTGGDAIRVPYLYVIDYNR